MGKVDAIWAFVEYAANQGVSETEERSLGRSGRPAVMGAALHQRSEPVDK